MRVVLSLVVILSALLAGCGGDTTKAVGTVPTAEGFAFTGADIAPRTPINPRYTCDGDNVSPTLTWTAAPSGTQELALVLEDPDAPGGTFTHWLAYGMPSGARAVPQGVPALPAVPGPTRLRQGKNGFGAIGYGGPCPPSGETHTYRFRLIALDTVLSLDPGVDREVFDKAIEGHVIAEARLEAPYTRQ